MKYLLNEDTINNLRCIKCNRYCICIECHNYYTDNKYSSLEFKCFVKHINEDKNDCYKDSTFCPFYKEINWVSKIKYGKIYDNIKKKRQRKWYIKLWYNRFREGN